MKLKYETGVATIIQFAFLELLAIPIVVVEIVSSCTGHGTQCSTNVFLSPIIFLLKAILYGALALIGYIAQEKRNNRLAWLLVLGELGLIPFSLFNLIHDTNYLTRFTSVIGLLFALWIIVLSYNLAHAKGGRIVKRASVKPRHRKPPTA
jgi:hypothetical protein